MDHIDSWFEPDKDEDEGDDSFVEIAEEESESEGREPELGDPGYLGGDVLSSAEESGGDAPPPQEAKRVVRKVSPRKKSRTKSSPNKKHKGKGKTKKRRRSGEESDSLVSAHEIKVCVYWGLQWSNCVVE
jgi:hypothetical protein